MSTPTDDGASDPVPDGEPEADGWISVVRATTLPPPRRASGTAAPHSVRAVRAQLALDFGELGGPLLLDRGQTVRLGRSRGWATPDAAGILSGESSVSARHASVEYAEDGTVWLTEVPEGSTNGVRVGRHVLAPGHRLRVRTGDTVWLGPHVSFRLRGGAPPAPPATDRAANGT
ncbi:FHA domain-containing protein [Streptomyces olivaceus]|uniref:FHA domain-containing protein n=1 Tax=Streptomyces olivaceus TaxID=47716 RepID=UPI0036E954CA